MSAPYQSTRMPQQLAQQLGYLSRSSQLFDLGYADEAIRIATSLRVLFHDRQNDRKDQGSIVKLLGKPPVRLLSTCPLNQLSPETFSFDGYLHLPGNIRPWKEYLEQNTQLIGVSEWWNQVIFVVNRNRVTRKDLVLWAAEKDGGAHTDSKTHQTYDAIMEMWIAQTWPGSAAQSVPIPPQHLFALRRFALEVLASDELTRLAIPSATNPRPETHLLYSFEPGADPVANRALDIGSYYLRNKALKDAGERRDLNTINRALQLLHELEIPFLTWRAEESLHGCNFLAAEADFRLLVENQPENHFALYGLGYCLRELGQHEESEATLQKALRSRPDHFQSRLTLANLYLKIDRFEDAIREYDSVLIAEPENENAKINRASAIQRAKSAKSGTKSGTTKSGTDLFSG